MNVELHTPGIFSASCRPAARSRRGGCGGHTLLELLVTVSLLLLIIGIPLLALSRVLNSAESRGAAEVIQGAFAEAQMETLSLGGRHVTSVQEGAWTLLRTPEAAAPGSAAETVSSDQLPAVSVDTNVERWSDGASVCVAFAGWLAAPDSAGSLFLGNTGVGSRVVIRAATGLTRREHR